MIPYLLNVCALLLLTVLQGLDADIFGELLSYIYSGTLHVSLDKVQHLYQAADLLQLDYVRDTCISYMAMNLERSTCVDMYKFADVFSVDILLRRCVEWIDINFTEFSFSEEFCSLSVNQLTEIISHDELDVKEETTVWEAVVRWVQHSKEDRLHHLPSILPHIRFNLLTSDDTAAILEHPVVREDPGSSEVIRNLVQNRNSNLKPRLGLTMEMALLYNRERSNELLFMNPQEGKYISCSYRPDDIPDSTAMTVTNDNSIYIMETKELEEDNQLSLFKYNHAKNIWESESMSSVFRGSKYSFQSYNKPLVEVNGILYYIVGVRDMYMLQMNKYNRHTNQWQECAELELDGMPHSSDCAILSCGPHLYFLTKEELHCYDPREDTWSRRTAPLVSYTYKVHTAIAMGTELFYTDKSFTMVYDTESDCWQKLQGWEYPDESVPDFGLMFFALENQLHVLLNYNNATYVYDRSADAWRDMKATLPNKSYVTYGCNYPVARITVPYLKGE
ncbi:kelch repeat and BTB domain-containing protein 2-like isoform X2 [Branchiostoma floridae]|uniref:Kelch repeat and BTB domain-containing protein 2-like isoform X2 n=1 Tax=Branchiostoma floridae TaxID=7739 RepID=A0A9J7MQE6_BRAFL|nr:kelch repeat and BTB domain-containing protein 2-like isoform X2 [Branchiostoma floridae]